MAAAVVQLFTFVNGRHLQSSATLEPIFKTISVSSNGSDNGTKITEVSGKFDFNAKKLSNVAAGAASGEVVTYDQRGANNGVASLDSGGKIPAAQLPTSVMEFKGAYNATTNSPTLVDGTGDAGDFYRVTVAGTQDFGSGNITFVVGDYVMYSGTVWQKGHSGADAVDSVNGQTGVVVLTTTNIAEGTNLYYTAARFNTAFATKTTDDLTEGSTNKYYTAARARADVIASSVTDGDTTHAPSGDAVFDAIAAATPTPQRSFVNNEGAGMTVRQGAFQNSFGNAKLLGAGVATVTEDSILLMVKDATIADTASGLFYLPGQIIPGFTGLVVNQPVYASKATPGSFQQDQTGFTTGDKVIKLGLAMSATELYFDPKFQYVIGG